MIILKLIIMVTGEAARTAPVKEGKSKELGVALANRFTFVNFATIVLTFVTLVLTIIIFVTVVNIVTQSSYWSLFLSSS